MLDIYGPTASSLPQTFERRAFVRYPRKLDVFWQFLGLSPRELTNGHVIDLSTTGVGLILDREFRINTTLMVRLRTTACGWSSHLVRVKRCQATEDGKFQIGCTFVKPLAVLQLQAHLD